MKRGPSLVTCALLALVFFASAGMAFAQTQAADRADRAEAAAAAHSAPPPPPPAPPAPSMGSSGPGSGSSGSGSSGGFAVPRSPGEGGRNRVGPRQGLEIANEDQQRRGGNASGVPPYSRPRPEGRPATGSATPRRTPPPSTDGGTIYRGGYYYNPYSYYYPYGIGAYGFGYFYDPFLWSPFGYGYGSYYGSPYGFDGYGYGTPYAYGGGGRQYRDVGSIRLKVKPEEAQVFVDGYYAGRVDDFDGIFQRLTLTAGPHRIEVRAPGHQSQTFEVQIVPGETITYRGDLLRE